MTKILLIDDDEDFNESLKDCLEYEGFTVVCAFGGKQGLSLLQVEQPDLVMTDILMPGFDGIEFLAALKEMSLGFPVKVIAMSGGGRIAGKEYLSVAKTIGADCVFEKPLDIDEVVGTIKGLLN
ncbi:MAG: response regulator [Gammaproteobacteria bacterium]|nr:response regulator [Gammaproteobacteria bacterium]